MKELVRFSFRETLVRITNVSGFERFDSNTNEWSPFEVRDLFNDSDVTPAGALMHLVLAASQLDGVSEDLGKQVFHAAMMTEAMQDLGFRSATLN